MENINDFSKIFSEMIKNFEKSGLIINESFIKNMIEKWKIKQFRLDENGSVTNNFALEKLEQISKKLLMSLPVNTMYTIIGLNKIQIKNAMRDEFCSNSLFFCMFCIGIHQYYGRKLKEPTNEELVFTNLCTSILDNTKGLLFSYMSEDFLTVIQKIRIIYESYVIFLYLNKHKQLVDPFLEHIRIIEHKIFKDLPGYDIENQINDSSNDFLSWTQMIIPDRTNRNLAFLAKDVGIDKDMSVIYKLSSNFIHTNAYSVFIKNTLDKNYIRTYLPFISDIMIRQTNVYINIVNKIDYQNEFISVLLGGLENILFSEIINPK